MAKKEKIIKFEELESLSTLYFETLKDKPITDEELEKLKSELGEKFDFLKLFFKPEFRKLKEL